MDPREDLTSVVGRVITPTDDPADADHPDRKAAPGRYATGTLGHDTVGVTPDGDVGSASASGDLTGGTPVGIENTDGTAGPESLRGPAGQE